MSPPVPHPLSGGILFAAAPHPSLQTPLSTAFSQLIGSWDLTMTRYISSTPLVLQGEWHFGWVLNGFAMQDVWIVPKRDLSSLIPGSSSSPWAAAGGKEFLEYGTTIRFFAAEEDRYRAVWSGPLQNKAYIFTAEVTEGEDGRLELEMVTTEEVGHEERARINSERAEEGMGRMRDGGRRMKWCLTGITEEAFEWREWITEDEVEGAEQNWVLREEFRCTRMKS